MYGRAAHASSGARLRRGSSARREGVSGRYGAGRTAPYPRDFAMDSELPARDWSMVQRSPQHLQFDARRCARLPCENVSSAPVAVCVISTRLVRGSIWQWSGYNIGHAAQFLFKCWSFWHEVAAASPVRLIVDTTRERRRFFASTWASNMLAAMSARFAPRLPSDCALLWGAPQRTLGRGGDRLPDAWFASPRHASALKTQVMGPRMADADQRGGTRVVVLRRGSSYTSASEGSRDWPHAEAFVAAANAAPPRVGPRPGAISAEMLWLHNESLVRQAELVHSADVIFTPHGSHGVSLAFVKRCAVVVELIPASYLTPMFADLAIEAGARAILLFRAPSVQAAINTTLAARQWADGHRGGGARMAASRNAGHFDELHISTAQAALRKALELKERCLSADASVHSDGLEPLLPGVISCASCHRPEDSPRCCEAGETMSSYFLHGGYACPRCLPRLTRLPISAAGCCDPTHATARDGCPNTTKQCILRMPELAVPYTAPAGTAVESAGAPRRLLQSARRLEEQRTHPPVRNSLGFSCKQSDYPGKSFRRGKVVQVHIPKTGGSSIERWSWRAGYNFKHEHLMPHLRRDPPDSFRFAFVRNPYTRAVSQYTFCRQGPAKTWNRGFPCHLVARDRMSFEDWWTLLWASVLRIGNGSLPSMHAAKRPGYLDGAFDRFGNPSSPGDPGYRKPPRFWCSADSTKPIWWGNCYGPVSQWVYKNGRSGARAVDWVGRLEDIDADFACLRQLLTDTVRGAPTTLVWSRDSISTKRSKESRRARNHDQYAQIWFRNRSVARLVHDHYGDDFVNFGYSASEFLVPGGSESASPNTRVVPG